MNVRWLISLSLLASFAQADPRLEGVLPLLKKLPRPNWVKPGARMVWWTTNRSAFKVKSAEGMATDKFMGGTGYTEVTVAAVDGKRACVSVRSFLSMGGTESEPPAIIGSLGRLVNASGGNYWVHPKALEHLLKQKMTAELKFGRDTREIDGKKYEGVAIGVPLASWFFDSKSGILLQMIIQENVKGQPGQAEARGSVATFEFRGFQQVNYPWINAPLPNWIQNVRHYRYTGQGKSSMQVLPGMKQPRATLNLTHTRLSGGTHWLLTRLEFDKTARGAPPPVETISGPGVIGLVLPPHILAKLRPGQLLERNKWAQSETRVISVGPVQGRNVAVIREEARKFTTEWHFDLKSGVLAHTTQIDRAREFTAAVSLQSAK